MQLFNYAGAFTQKLRCIHIDFYLSFQLCSCPFYSLYMHFICYFFCLCCAGCIALYTSRTAMEAIPLWNGPSALTPKFSNLVLVSFCSNVTKSCIACMLQTFLSLHFLKQFMRIQRKVLEALWLSLHLGFLPLTCYSLSSVICYWRRYICRSCRFICSSCYFLLHLVVPVLFICISCLGRTYL